MKLFEPIAIKGMAFKNRLVMAPMEVGISLGSPRSRAYYTERARGGVGSILTAAVAADFWALEEAFARPGGLQRFLQRAGQLVEEVRREGALIGAQLWHGNRYPAYKAFRERGGGDRVAPSPRRGKTEWWEEVGEMRELTLEELEALISLFGRAARGVKEAGFDFVELHGAHGYLLSQFFSPLFNHRRDSYGGDLKGRMRFGLEMVRTIRKAVGDGYPLFYRLGAWDDTPGGVNVEDSLAFSQELEAAGVDVLDISVAPGIYTPEENYKNICPLKKAPMGTFAWIAQAIRQGVKIPVIAVGRFNSHKVAEEALSQGKADLIALGRQLIADPFWPKKVQEGRFKEIVACESCNKECFDHMRGKSFGCHLNPRAGREGES